MTASILIRVILAVAGGFFGFLEGNGAVWIFNRIPESWLRDYGEPLKEDDDPYRQRIRRSPWRYLFSGLFVVLNITMFEKDWQFGIMASAAIWFLLEMAIADKLYRIVPDQFIVLLAVCGLGFIPYHGNWQDSLFGAAIGFGVTALIELLGKVTYRRDAIGGGDIKLFTALGFVCGVSGVIFIFAASAVLAAMHFVLLLARKKIKKTDSLPMVPYIAVCAAAYLAFFWGKFEIIEL